MTEIKPTNLTQIPTGVDVGQTRVQTERASVPEVGAPVVRAPQDGVEQSRGVQVRGQDQTLASSQPLGAEALTNLAQLNKNMGPIGKDVAQRADVDFAVAEGALFNTPGTEHQATFKQVGLAMKGDDVFLQGRLCAALGAYTASGQYAQQQDAMLLFKLPYGDASARLRPVVDSFASSSGALTTAGQNALTGFSGNFPQDINSLVQWVLRESYLENLQDLAFYAAKVRFYNNLKKKIREELNARRMQQANYAGKPGETPLTTPFAPTNYDSTYYGDPQLAVTGGELTAEQKAEIEAIAAEKARQAEIAKAIAEFEAARKANTATKDVKINGYTDPGPTTDTKQYAENYGKSLVNWYNSLPEDQKAAVREYLEQNGMSFNVKSEEHDGWSGNESETRSVSISPLAEGADIEAYLMAAANEAGSNMLTTVDGSSAYKWDINLGSGPWGQTVAVPDESAVAMPQILKDIGYVPGSNAPPVTSASGGLTGEWAPGDPVTNKEGLEKYIENLEEKLNSVGDDAQLANVDLQNMLQKQQQTLQMMSNISKMIHDTAMAIIRKIGG